MDWPDGFWWGTGASSTQCEGAAPASDWWDWERSGHAPLSGDGNGFGTRYAEDFALLADLGLTHHRLSMEWARLEPEPGVHDTAAVRHYRDVLQAAHDAGDLAMGVPPPLHAPPLVPGVRRLPRRGQSDRRLAPPRRLRRRDIRRPCRRVAAGQRDELLRPSRLRRTRMATGSRRPDREGSGQRGDPPGQRRGRRATGANRRAGLLHLRAVADRAPGRRCGHAVDGRALFDYYWSPGLGLFRDGVLQVPGREPIERPELAGFVDMIGFSYYGTMGVREGEAESSTRPTLPSPPSATASGPDGLGLVLDRIHEELPDTPVLVAEYGIGTDDDDVRADYLTQGLDIGARCHRPRRRRAGVVPLDGSGQLRVAPRLRRLLRHHRPPPLGARQRIGAGPGGGSVTDGWRLGPFTPVDQEVSGQAARHPLHVPRVRHGPGLGRKGRLQSRSRCPRGTRPHAPPGGGHSGSLRGTSRIGLAVSDDGLNFEVEARPVLFPDDDPWQAWEWPGGCEDPRVVESPDGGFVTTYTAFDGKVGTLFVATSDDLRQWNKHGPAFGSTPYALRSSKSGSIVTELHGGRLVAARLDGRFWMYWGEGTCFAATSEDLVRWTPIDFDATRDRYLAYDRSADQPWNVNAVPGLRVLRPILFPRRRRFDSLLVEPGPPALSTGDGIVLIYNGANHVADGDTSFQPFSYQPGQALFDARDPASCIARDTGPFLRAGDLKGARLGQVANVCFAQSLVLFKDRWHLYFGMADSRIGCAVAVSGPRLTARSTSPSTTKLRGFRRTRPEPPETGARPSPRRLRAVWRRATERLVDLLRHLPVTRTARHEPHSTLMVCASSRSGTSIAEGEKGDP